MDKTTKKEKGKEKSKEATLEEKLVATEGKLVSAEEKLVQAERINSELRDALRHKDAQINNAQDEINRLKISITPPAEIPLEPTGSAGSINR